MVHLAYCIIIIIVLNCKKICCWQPDLWPHVWWGSLEKSVCQIRSDPWTFCCYKWKKNNNCDATFLKWSLHTLCFFIYTFQPRHALILVCLVFWVLHLEDSWLESYLLEHCGLSKLKQVRIKFEHPHVNWPLFEFIIITFCLIQGTQLDWTLAQLQQISLVRLLTFICIHFFPSYHLISFSLWFLQDAPAQGQNGNLFPPTLPLLRTAAPMPVLEAPRAHQPAAWHDKNLLNQQGYHLVSESLV